jgi:nicotinate dehydrogenase subunit A
MPRTTINVNGVKHSVLATVDTPLLFILRNELRLHGPRFGCGLAQCGACTALLGDQAIRTCVTPVGAVEGKKVTTLEGLGTAAKPHPLQTAFIEHQAAQCGYCTNAMIMGAESLMRLGAIKADTSDDKIRLLMNQYLCRCGTHFRILAAIKSAAKATAAGGKA